MWHRMYFHVVWTTRDRQPLIDARYAAFLCRFLRAVARQERTQILEIGLVATHVHVLMRVHPTTSVSSLLQRLKGGSSVIGSRQHRGAGGEVRWARGYSITSVSPRTLPAVREYLRTQARRHPTEAIGEWKGDRAE
jgi:REP element-mobilizing transposase RayT